MAGAAPSNQEPLYKPLDPAKREIRLFQILRGSEDGPIEGCFHTVSLDDDDIDFAALSYVWGNAIITQDVIVNGHRRAVTTNLESAIRNFWSFFHENGVNIIRRHNLAKRVIDGSLDSTALRRSLASRTSDLHNGSDSDDISEPSGSTVGEDKTDMVRGRGREGDSVNILDECGVVEQSSDKGDEDEYRTDDEDVDEYVIE
jgi:hypothetical protein